MISVRPEFLPAENDNYDAERAAQVETAKGVLVFDGSGGGGGNRGPAARVRGEHEESLDADPHNDRNQRGYDEFPQSQSISFCANSPERNSSLTFEYEIGILMEERLKKFAIRNSRGRRPRHSRARFDIGRRKIGPGNSEVTIQ